MKPKKQTPPPITIQQVVSAVNSIVPRSVRSIRTDLEALKIKPVGKRRQRPQRYPWNTPQRLVASLGYETALMQLPPLDTAVSALATITKRKATR